MSRLIQCGPTAVTVAADFTIGASAAGVLAAVWLLSLQLFLLSAIFYYFIFIF